jgi:hypothetical protein
MEAILSSKSSVHTRSTWCHIPENGILPSHCCENFKSYKLPLNEKDKTEEKILSVSLTTMDMKQTVSYI